METTEKKYNYFYYNTPILKSLFVANVPENWEEEVNEYGEYSFGGYRAVEVEVEK